MFRFLVLIAAVVVTGQSHSTSVSQCRGNAGGLPINTYVEGCKALPCVLPQLQDAVIKTIFRAPHSIETMRTRATVRIGVLPIAFALEEKAQTCNYLTNASCPVKEGDVLEYTLNIPIEPFFPVGVQVSVEFQVEDEANAPVFCVSVPIVIGAPVEKLLKN